MNGGVHSKILKSLDPFWFENHCLSTTEELLYFNIIGWRYLICDTHPVLSLKHAAECEFRMFAFNFSHLGRPCRSRTNPELQTQKPDRLLECERGSSGSFQVFPFTAVILLQRDCEFYKKNLSKQGPDDGGRLKQTKKALHTCGHLERDTAGHLRLNLKVRRDLLLLGGLCQKIRSEQA